MKLLLGDHSIKEIVGIIDVVLVIVKHISVAVYFAILDVVSKK